jgi:hypothetical protein
MAAGPHQIPLRIQAMAGLPRLYHTFRNRLRSVGESQIVINADYPPKTAALRTSPDGMVEAEERRRWLAIFNVALGAVEAVAEE